jgi:hypothetical protein
MKNQIYFAAGMFLASLLAFIAVKTLAAALVMGVSAAAYGFIAYMNREADLELDALREQVKSVSDQLSNINVTLGFRQ